MNGRGLRTITNYQSLELILQHSRCPAIKTGLKEATLDNQTSGRWAYKTNASMGSEKACRTTDPHTLKRRHMFCRRERRLCASATEQLVQLVFLISAFFFLTVTYFTCSANMPYSNGKLQLTCAGAAPYSSLERTSKVVCFLIGYLQTRLLLWFTQSSN